MQRLYQCKVCRRYNQKLFLKGERCFSAKCAMVKKPYPPGRQGKNAFRRKPSDYGQQLAEKQKLRLWYNLSERQFRRYVSEILNKPKRYKNPSEGLIQRLESRLDNIVYRAGLAESRIQARHLVVHGHFQVDGRKVDRPSFSIAKDQLVSVKEKSHNQGVFKKIAETRENTEASPWLKTDRKKMEAKVLRLPVLEEVNPPAQVSTILEFYAR